MSGYGDIAPLIAAAGNDSSPFGQGILTSWDPATLENTVKFRGELLTDLGTWMGVNALSLKAGDNVILARMAGDGTSTWFIAGRADIPPLADPVAVKGGTVIVEGGGGISVRDGGDITVAAGGEVRSENFDGNTANNNAGTTGFALGNDLLAIAGVFVPAVDTTANSETNTNYSITTTYTNKADVTFTVPDWATEATVIAIGLMTAINASGTDDQAQMRVTIDGNPSIEPITPTNSGVDPVWFSVPHARVFNVSAIPSFVVAAQQRTLDHTWPADPANGASITALVMWKSEQ